MQKKRHLTFLLCWATIFPIIAQNCRSILNEAKSAYSSNNIKQAFKKLQDTETCDYKNELLQERQVLQNSIFKAIDDQRIEAENNTKKIQESALKVRMSENETQAALRKAQTALDSLNIILDKLGQANAEQVRLILAAVERNQQELNFDAAVDKIKTAKILRALPDSVNLAYLKLCRSLLTHAREDLQRKEYKSALAKIKSAGELNIMKDSVAAANEALRHFLLENTRLDIMNTDYDAAVEKINAVNALKVSPDTVGSVYFEIAFCYIEVGRLDRAAGLLDTLAQMRNDNAARGFLSGFAGKDLKQKAALLRQMKLQLDSQRNNSLIARYFPTNTEKIQGGTFSLGSGLGDESRGNCPVVIKPFILGNNEVTFFEYDLFCAATNHRKPSDNGWGRGQRPVIDIDWHDAVEYCNWRSRQEGLIEAYLINKESEKSKINDSTTIKYGSITCNWWATGYRLPTEAEWEFAAGNGDKHTRYGWGNENPTSQKGGNVTDETAKTKFPNWEIFSDYTDGFAYTAPTGSYPPNQFGLYDMTGNVWEWCWDWYDENYCRANKNRNAAQGASSGTERVLRGGSWGSFPKDCIVSSRFHNKPYTRNYSIGFRLARN